MDTRNLAGIARLSESLGDSRTVQENVALAGNLLARTLATLRARQAELEAARARLRHGEASPIYAQRVTEADGATLAVSRIAAEVARLSLNVPESDDSTVAVYGYVTDGDKPVSSGNVGLMDGNRAVARAELGSDGSFSLSVQSSVPLALRVASKRGGSSFSDSAPINAPGPLPTYRFIDLAAPSPAGGQGTGGPKTGEPGGAAPAGPGGGMRVRGDSTRRASPASSRDVAGETLNQGLKILRDRGVPVAGVSVKPTGSAGPKIAAVSRNSKSGEVALEVHTRGTDTAKLDVLAAVLAHDPSAAPAGMTSFDSARGWLRAKKVKNMADVQSLASSPIAELRQRFKLGTKSAAALKDALTSALGKIDYGAGG